MDGVEATKKWRNLERMGGQTIIRLGIENVLERKNVPKNSIVKKLGWKSPMTFCVISINDSKNRLIYQYFNVSLLNNAYKKYRYICLYLLIFIF